MSVWQLVLPAGKGGAYLIDDSHPSSGYDVLSKDGTFLYRTIWTNIAFDFRAA